MKWKIKDVEIKNQVVLAPMAGVTIPSYIKICEEMKVGYAITELLSAEAIIRNNAKTFEMLEGIENIKIPVAVQIFGANPKSMVEAAKILIANYHIKILDINMGCPVPKVAIAAQAGSGLLKNPTKIKEIVSEVVKNVNVPVTVKIRSGWDENSINCVEVAKAIEDAGASAITLHARTRSQGYSGKANWDLIKKVKETVKIPVIGNGDVKSCFDAKKMLEETHCDAIMIGRAALGNPWLIKECVEYLENETLPKKVSSEEKINMIKTHFNAILQNKNEKAALLEIRSMILYYLKGMPKAKSVKQQICEAKDKETIDQILNQYEKDLKENLQEF